jgi:hypothetical protein
MTFPKLVLTALAVTLCVAAPAGAGTTSSITIAPTKGSLFGAFPNDSGGVTTLEGKIGRKLAIDHRYVPWNFTTWSAFGTDIRAGRIPMISWSAAPLTTASAIAGGSQDTRIRNAALALHKLGGRILLRPFYEFDQPHGHPRYIGTPTQVIAAWRRTFTIFKNAGATNVRFVWCPMAVDFPRGVAQHFWPGATYVNWVGTDGYNFPGQSWRSFGEIFGAAFTFAVNQGKPLIIAETASPARDPRTPAWMAGAAAWIQTHPDLKAVSYFDSVSPKGYDFRVTSNANTLSAYRSWSQRTYFKVW